MKKIFILIVLFSLNTYSQTFNEVLNIASYYGKTFSEFEKGNNTLSKESNEKFGIESRSYFFNNFNMLLSELEDNELIGKIQMLTKDNVDNHESWYNVCKYVDKDSNFKFIRSLISVKDSDINNTNISYTELLKILRNSNDLSAYVYIIVYQKENLYYEFIVVRDSFMINITSKPTIQN